MEPREHGYQTICTVGHRPRSCTDIGGPAICLKAGYLREMFKCLFWMLRLLSERRPFSASKRANLKRVNFKEIFGGTLKKSKSTKRMTCWRATGPQSCVAGTTDRVESGYANSRLVRFPGRSGRENWKRELEGRTRRENWKRELGKRRAEKEKTGKET